jgi:Flp pilus assembly protein TadG
MVAGRVTKTNLLVRLWSDESGASAIELAVVTTFILVPLLLGATELGRRAWTKSEIENAARAGVEYAYGNLTVKTTNCTLSSAASTAINNAAVSTTSRIAVTATSSAFCGCPTSSGVTVQAIGTNCSDGMAVGNYLKVKAATTYTPLYNGCLWKDAPLDFCSVVTLSWTETTRLD